MYTMLLGSFRLPTYAYTNFQHHQILPFQFPRRFLPSYVDLRSSMTPVENQEQTDACTANAFTGAIEYILKRRTGLNIDVSRFFMYYNARLIEGNGSKVTDEGASQKAIVLGLLNFGVCEEYFWPYKTMSVNQKPPPHAYAAASQNSIVPMKIPRNLNAMKVCLSNGIPFVIAIRLTPSATLEARYYGGFVSMPNPNDHMVKSILPHAVLIVGYDERTRHFIVRNSWGQGWGDNGYFYIPYEYVLERNLVNANDDVWAILDVVPRTGEAPVIWQMVSPSHNNGEQY